LESGKIKKGGNGMTTELKEAIEYLKERVAKLKKWKEDGDLTEAIDTVIAEVEKPKYMADDMEAFLLWASDNGWFYGRLTEMWHNYAEIDINADYDTSKRYSIKEVLKIWEQQRKEATE
jgi:hypothetical protein